MLDPLQTAPGPAHWPRPLAKFSTFSAPAGEDGLKRLALQGAWRTIAERTQGFQSAGPHGSKEALEEAAWHVLALAKLRVHGAALEVLKTLGQLDAPEHSDTDGRDRVPWMLRWLQADLPGRLGRPQESMDRFYALFDFCSRQAELQPLAEQAESEQQAWQSRWQLRQNAIAGTLMTQHIRLREYASAFGWLGWALDRHPGDMHLRARVGYLQLAIGDLNAAADTFKGIAEPEAKAPAGLVRCNKGLLLFAQGDYKGAVKEYDAALSLDPDDSLAANNRAVARMYACNLVGAIQALETDLRTRAAAHLQETLLLNLSSMYELSSAGVAAENKRVLSDWASRAGPDDLDNAVIRTA